MNKGFVLLSGGLDSTVVLHKALLDQSWVEAVSVNYGQRHSKELDYARVTCNALGLTHTVLDLSSILRGSLLTGSNKEIPSVPYSELPYGVSPTYVPFRNGTLLSLITAHAQKWVNAELDDTQEGDDEPQAGVYFGAHQEDAHNWAYPDCTPEFIGAMANAIYVGTYRRIRLHAPVMWMQKHEIVTLGNNLGVNFASTWSCYRGDEKHCGVCPTCRARRAAFEQAGIPDPTEYAGS